MFAKLYEFEDIGQVLVKVDQSDDGCEVKVYFEPEGLGVCSAAINFPDTDTGHENAQRCFKAVTEHHAGKMARDTIATLK